MKDILKSISIHHTIGLNMKYFGMKNSGRDKMIWAPCGSHVVSYILTIKIIASEDFIRNQIFIWNESV